LDTTAVVAPVVVYGVTVDPAADAKSDAPGATVVYALQVTNNGNTLDTFDVTVNGETWTTTPDQVQIVDLAAGDSTTINVAVDIPAGAAGGDSDTATVTVTSQGDNGQSASSDLTTTANTIHLGELTGVATLINTNNEIWRADATVLAHDTSHNPVADAEVSVEFSWINKNNGNNNQEVITCITNQFGYCTANRDFNPQNVEDEVTLTVTGISHITLTMYEPAANDVADNTMVQKP
jgi:hypothetical protein